MFGKKEEKEKFVKVPQVEIDDKLYHESAEIAFGILREKTEINVKGNKKVTLLFKLKKYVMVRGKVADETVVRAEEGLDGMNIIKKQLEIEARKELKRVNSDL